MDTNSAQARHAASSLPFSCVQFVSMCPGLWAKMAFLAILPSFIINKLRVCFRGLALESLSLRHFFQ